jgi:hypothetical protein
MSCSARKLLGGEQFSDRSPDAPRKLRCPFVSRPMTASQRDVTTIDRHIAESEDEIRRQREQVEELRRGSRSMIAEEAQQLLSKMIDALEEMKEHRRVIINNLQPKG